MSTNKQSFFEKVREQFKVLFFLTLICEPINTATEYIRCLYQIYLQFTFCQEIINSYTMRWQWFINLFMMFAVSSFAQQTADTLANSKTKQILAYIAGLPQQGIFVPKKEIFII